MIIVVLITTFICAYSSNLQQNHVMKKKNQQIKTNYIKNAMDNLWIIKNISNSF